MTLSINDGGYAFLIRLDLMFSMSLWKEFQSLQILNDLSINHLIKLTLYENDIKLLKFKRSLVQVNLWYVRNMCEILAMDSWNEYIKENNEMVNLFFYRKFNIRKLIV